MERQAALWKKYFRDPSQWFDNRKKKCTPLFPDFKHKESGESLWINSTIPYWVHEELRRLDTSKQDCATFIASLKTCAKTKDLQRGILVHADITRKGLLEKNNFVASTLVNMYAKCGAFAKAKEVLERLPARDVVTWNALIAGYAQEGYNKEVLKCFEQMQREGLSPSEVTYTCILKACGSLRALDRGQQVHLEVARQGHLENSVVLGGALVDMYAKCGALAKAKESLEALAVRDVVTWSALIAGYAQEGQGEEALKCFKQMQHDGFVPNAVTFTCILKACGSIGAVVEGEQVHAEVAKQGLLWEHVVLGIALVDMYAKCGAFAKAKAVLEGLPVRNVVTWNALISGYTQHGHGGDALNCFEEMQREGLSPTSVTFTCILKACSCVRALEKGIEIHDKVVRRGLLQGNLGLCAALVDMYVKCGVLAKAKEVLHGFPDRDKVIWSALISGYAQAGDCKETLKCFEQMQREHIFPDTVTFVCLLKACGTVGDIDTGKQVHADIVREGLLGGSIVLGNALVDMYVKCGAVLNAKEVFEGLSVRNEVTWNALIAGFTQHEHNKEALNCFVQMQFEGLFPSAVTFTCILNACGRLEMLELGEQIHREIARQELLERDIVLSGALVDMYCKCCAFVKAEEVHRGLMVRDVVTWNALISGYAQEGFGVEALECFGLMQSEGVSPDSISFACILKACSSIGAVDDGEQVHAEILRWGLLAGNVGLGNALVSMYTKCGLLIKAKEVLEGLPAWDVTTWNALITGYAQLGYGEETLNSFDHMQSKGISPDTSTFVCILRVCGNLGALDKGQEIHTEVITKGFLQEDVMLGNALVDMYVSCGMPAKAKEVLDELSVRDVVTWNILITGYTQHGYTKELLNCFEQMQHDGFFPNEVTFLCMLNLCSHAGLLEEGEFCFRGMSTNYGIIAFPKHHTCMVDLFGRAGDFVKALGVIEAIPSSVGCLPMWHAFMGACSKWKNVELGEWAFGHAMRLDVEDAASYISMSNIYTLTGMNDEVNRIEAMRVKNNAWKDTESVLCDDLINDICVNYLGDTEHT